MLNFLYRTGILSILVRFSRAVREEVLKACKYNVELITNRMATVDMVTDSYMHRFAPRRIMRSGNRAEASFIQLEDSLKKYFGYEYVFPVAQGRWAESILLDALAGNKGCVPNNGLFITTRTHIKNHQLVSVEITKRDEKSRFKADVDTERLENLLENGSDNGQKVSFVYLECSNNALGGYPISLGNLRKVYTLTQKYNSVLLLDPTRILENAWFIKNFEQEFREWKLADIVSDICRNSDGCAMSLTKDFFTEKGGFIGVRDATLAKEISNTILLRGDGLSVRDKGGLNNALRSGMQKPDSVKHRIGSTQKLHAKLQKAGIPVLSPFSGHAVYMPANKLLEDSGLGEFPLESFLAELYLSSGVAAAENYCSPAQEEEGVRYIRLAIPYQGLSWWKINYVSRSLNLLWERKDKIKPLALREEKSEGMFFKQFEYAELQAARAKGGKRGEK